jgi:CubicO group peptidase (beta-lactamase class C family)
MTTVKLSHQLKKLSPLLLALAAAGLHPLVPAAHAQPDFGNVPPLEFDKSAYERRLHQAFRGQAKGYAAVLIRNGRVVSEVSGGLARNHADGRLEMTTTIPVNVGSTIKFTAGVALLHLFESQDKTINPKGHSVEEWLDQRVYTYFPRVWRDEMHPSIKKIKFSHLLKHKTGFRSLEDEDLGEDSVNKMFDYLRKGVPESDFERPNGPERKYANANIQLLTYLIPMIADPSLMAKVDQEVARNKWSAEGLELHRRMADAFVAYMHGKIYGKITPAIRPSCNPTVEFPKRNQPWAFEYQSAQDATKGRTNDGHEVSGHCAAQGGWYIQARELAAFVANFEATNTLVSESTRRAMFDDDNADEMLVWSKVISDALIRQKFRYSSLPYMGGTNNSGDNHGSRATLLALPNGYYGIGAINSTDLSSNGITRRLLRAFKTGIGMPEDPDCAGLAQKKKQIEALRAELVTAQQDLQDAPPGQKAAYAALVKKARERLDAVLATAENLDADIEAKLCIV